MSGPWKWPREEVTRVLNSRDVFEDNIVGVDLLLHLVESATQRPCGVGEISLRQHLDDGLAARVDGDLALPMVGDVEIDLLDL